MAAIRFAGVWKRYGAVDAVRNLDLTCADGEMLALLGPSGCGKTSTLKMVAGIEDVSAGEIYFDDRPVSGLAPAERNIAMVFEDYALYAHLSVFENIAFPLRIRGMAGAEIDTRVRQAIDLLGLGTAAEANVRGLSGGAQQRVSIGRALVRDPELILFDEPLSHLDGDQKIQLRAEIKRLQQTTGLTAILVTHDQTEAIAMSDRVAVMEGGVLQQCDPPQQLYDHPDNMFVAQFIGEPPMNLIPVDARGGSTGVTVEGGGWRVRLSDELADQVRRHRGSGRLVLGVRPEHVDIVAAGAASPMEEAILGAIDWIELRGDTRICAVTLADGAGGAGQGIGHPVLIESSAATMLAPGDRVEIRPRPQRLNLFDAGSGRNLRLGQAREAILEHA